jgi:hypothetical protein
MSSIFRSVLERMSRGRTFRRRLPSRFGSLPMYVTPDAALSYWTKSLDTFDPALLRAAEHLVASGDTVWDVGANAGCSRSPPPLARGPAGACWPSRRTAGWRS